MFVKGKSILLRWELFTIYSIEKNLVSYSVTTNKLI